MPRRGENIRKRKDGRWEGRIIVNYRENGRAVYKSVYGKTYLEVKTKLQKESSIKKHLYKYEQRKKVTFSEVLDCWMIYKQYSLAPSSIVKYQLLIDKHIRPEIGSIEVQELNSVAITGLIEKKMKGNDENNILSSSMLQSIVYIIRAAYNYYAMEEHISEIKINQKLCYKPKQKIYILNMEEQGRLERILLEELNESKLGIMICLYTGLRLGEICALKWEDISLESESISITKTVQRLSIKESDRNQRSKLVISSPKSICSIRTIPVPTILSDIMKDFQKKYVCHGVNYVLSGQSGKPMEPRTYENHFKRYLKYADIADYKFHTLRHTFATNCIQAGVDVKSLSEILGHSNVTITLQRYVHSSFDMKKAQIEKLCSIWGQNYGQESENR